MHLPGILKPTTILRTLILVTVSKVTSIRADCSGSSVAITINAALCPLLATESTVQNLGYQLLVDDIFGDQFVTNPLVWNI